MKVLREALTYNKKIKVFWIEWENKELEVIKSWEYAEDPWGYEMDYEIVGMELEDVSDELNNFIGSLE